MASVESLSRHCQIVARRLGVGSVVPFLGAGANLCERPSDARWEDGYLPSGAELAACGAWIAPCGVCGSLKDLVVRAREQLGHG
jgi:hypothetical protein